jgi:hypothetical protein
MGEPSDKQTAASCELTEKKSPTAFKWTRRTIKKLTTITGTAYPNYKISTKTKTKPYR